MVALGSPEMAVRVPSEGFGRGRPLAQAGDALCFDAERGLNAGPYMYDENHGKILALAGELQLPVGSASPSCARAPRSGGVLGRDRVAARGPVQAVQSGQDFAFTCTTFDWTVSRVVVIPTHVYGRIDGWQRLAG